MKLKNFITMRVPTYLYHGSAFAATVLKPGFEHTGVEVKWDEVETNRFLYTTEDKDFAKEMGFATSLDKKYMMKGFHSHDDEITILLDQKSNPMTLAGLRNTWYYLYTIRYRYDDGWVKNDNPVNNAENEWKTAKTITSIIRAEHLSCYDFIKNKKLTVEHPRYPILRLGYSNVNHAADS